MKIDFHVNNGTLCVALDGRLDTNTAPMLESFLNENADTAAAWIINCEKLTYVSSAGLRVLLAAQKKMKDSMKITVAGNEERILLVALYDNLGKGASGAAIECMNIALGEEKTRALDI